jgi:outer membrane protein assembly factor BamB
MRRRLRSLVLVPLSLLLLTAASPAGPTGGASWPQVGLDATHTAHNQVETVLSPETVPQLVEKWRAELGGEHGSTPVVDGSLVFQTSYENGALTAFDVSTGTQVWQASFAQREFVFAPAVAGGRLFATRDSTSTLYALDPATGGTLWTISMDGSGTAPPSAVVEGGKTTVLALGGSTVHAVDGATGTVHWSHRLFPPFALQATPAVANGVVYVPDYEPVLHAYDLASGAEIWATRLGGENATPTYPVLDNGMVFVATLGGHLFALDQATGDVLWTKEVGAASQLSAANGTVYVHRRYQARRRSYLLALHQASGELRWSAPLWASNVYTTHDGASIANGVVYTTALSGAVVALDEGTGALLWRSPAPWAASMPAIVDGVIYASGGNHLLSFGL